MVATYVVRAICPRTIPESVRKACPESVRDSWSGMSGFKLDILDMAEHDPVRSCPVMSGNMSNCVR